MKEFNQRKLKFNTYLEKLYQSNKPLIIYKVDGGYNIYTDFSKKITLNKNNIDKFYNQNKKNIFFTIFLLILITFIAIITL